MEARPTLSQCVSICHFSRVICVYSKVDFFATIMFSR